MSNKKNTTLPTTEEQDEMKALEARLAELKGKYKEESKSYIEDEKIQQDSYIPVMSLLPYPLNLSTREFGQGNVKRFTKFGEVKKILYKDLVDILEVHQNFFEAGYCYIMSPAFVRQNGLDDLYSKILTKENIEQIITTNSEECVNLYNSATPEQKHVIIHMLTEKAKINPDALNLNVVDRISRLSGVNILEVAKESKDLFEKSETSE